MAKDDGKSRQSFKMATASLPEHQEEDATELRFPKGTLDCLPDRKVK